MFRPIILCLLIGLAQAQAQDLPSCEGAFGRFDRLEPQQFPPKGALTEIPPAELAQLRKPDQPLQGDNHWALHYAELGGEPVFIKVSFALSQRSGGYAMFEKEALWVKYLSDLGIGPRFHGTTRVGERFSTVTSLFRGFHINDLEDFRRSQGAINQKTIADLERIIATFERNGIIPMDFHFRMNAEGRVLVIDPAFYLKRGQDVPADFAGTGLGAVRQYLDFARQALQERAP